jgi:hypothetical protein
MDRSFLVEADRIVALLSPGKQEAVREIVIHATSVGALSENARHFLSRATGSELVADVLTAAIAEGDPGRSLPLRFLNSSGASSLGVT